jgi:hypothetical protein
MRHPPRRQRRSIARMAQPCHCHPGIPINPRIKRQPGIRHLKRRTAIQQRGAGRQPIQHHIHQQRHALRPRRFNHFYGCSAQRRQHMRKP